MSIFENAVDLTDVKHSDYPNYIGNGYRYCCYRLDHDKNGVIILFGFDNDGNRKTFIVPHKSHIKYNVAYKTKEKDIFGRYVETKYFKNTKERKSYVDACGDSLPIIEMFPPQNEFLHEVFDGVALDETFNKQKLRTFFFDIETEISESFMKPVDALNRINAITIYDTETEKYYTWTLSSQKIDITEDPLCNMPKEKFVFFDFHDNELHMLDHFLSWFEENYPDVLCGFNSQSYDVPYLVRRIENIMGKNDAARISPVGKYRIRENNLDNERANKQAEIIVDIDGIFSADFLVLYRDKYKINQPLDGGNSLDNIGEVEGCGKKINYKGTKSPSGETINSLKDLYEKDWSRFINYNIRDVDLLRKLEEKLKTINLSRVLTSSGLSNYDAIYSSIGYLIGSLSMFSKIEMGTVFPSYKVKKNQRIPYEGAYVFPPTPGLYTGGIACIDFNSLYPNSIIAANVSPETYVGKISRFPITNPSDMFFAKEPPIDLNGTDTTKVLKRTDDEVEYAELYGHRFNDIGEDKDIKKFYFLPANGSEQKVITREQLDRLLEEKCIFTRNNTLYLKHSVKTGVVAAWSEHFYKIRKSTKKKGQKLAIDLHKGLIKENIEETKELIQNLDNTQQARKIALNSIYGCLSTPFSPIYNPYSSQSVTRQGRYANQSSSEYIRKCFKERFGISEKYIVPISGDTDSSFFSSHIRVKDNNLLEN